MSELQKLKDRLNHSKRTVIGYQGSIKSRLASVKTLEKYIAVEGENQKKLEAQISELEKQ